MASKSQYYPGHKKSYKDAIRAYNKIREEEKDPTLTTHLFSAHIFPFKIQDETKLIYPEKKWWFQNSTHGHKYEFSAFQIKPYDADKMKRYTDSFNELLGGEGLLMGMFKDQIDMFSPDEDFLFGSYLVRSYFGDNITVLLIGCKSGLASGITSMSPGNTYIYGVDKKHKKSNMKNVVLINGSTNKGDICDSNVLRSICIQYDEHTTTSPSLCICDVRPDNITTLYSAAWIFMKKSRIDSVLVFRMPDLETWGDSDPLLLVNFIILLVVHHRSVQFFVTPWGKKPRVYLMCRNRKVTNKYDRILFNYTKILKSNKIPLFTSNYFLKQAHHIVDWATIVWKQMTESKEQYSVQLANDLWLKHIMNQHEDSEDSDEKAEE